MLRVSLVFLALAHLAAPAASQTPRPAEEILREFDRVTLPSRSDGNSPQAVARFRRAIEDGCRRKGDLALELWRSHPTHRRVPEVMGSAGRA